MRNTCTNALTTACLSPDINLNGHLRQSCSPPLKCQQHGHLIIGHVTVLTALHSPPLPQGQTHDARAEEQERARLGDGGQRLGIKTDVPSPREVEGDDVGERKRASQEQRAGNVTCAIIRRLRLEPHNACVLLIDARNLLTERWHFAVPYPV